MMVFIKAFVIGGMICALTQILMEKNQADARKDYGTARNAGNVSGGSRFI